ncbi:MAG: bifunctional diaminohydroxyphosphoribosylaminopyrimidine deaminase/5-amino-6-(5-phosphoribosylamino)uracil reductase RibD [Muribaculaceae bacterium]|nr:bifunctional diaminohydroxyphosphoribosylaminopyrimidine deaminase/5-amino-6-(5-phosphoribosylamino)uracil reductase RibD [Muribaculaceae bacterium]
MEAGEQKYLERALELARHAEGVSLPNPMVGAVIVAPDGRIIGEGFTAECGKGHAEVNAVASVKEEDHRLLRESTIYVTLEPCSHYGKTPPCAELLCRIGVRRAVVGTTDPFAKVSGRGLAMLREAGIEVEMAPDEFAARCMWLNRRFFTAHTLKRPFITLKWARSADGWLDRRRSEANPGPAAISTAIGRVAVHRLRAVHDAILTGSGTILADRPRLDARLSGGKDPQPVIFDVRHRLTAADISTVRQPIIIGGDIPLSDSLRQLYDRGLTSVLVEGGSDTLRRFIESGLWDEAREEVAPVVFGTEGIAAAPVLAQQPCETYHIGSNRINLYSQSDVRGVKNL